MTRPMWVSGQDLERPSAARMYDYYLGGSHNFEADRALARTAVAQWPDLPLIMRANRSFLHRAVRYVMGLGIDQFLDLGSGIPTAGNVHEIAQGLNPRSRVVYVDIDPVTVAHSQMLLREAPGTAVIHADVRDSERILTDPLTTALLDFSRPVAVMMVALLHFIPDEDDPGQVVARYRDALTSGSQLVLSHATLDGDPAAMREHEAIYRSSATPIQGRSRSQIERLLDGFEPVDPGVVHLPLWRPDPGAGSVERPERYSGYAAVARLP
jgi:SAM-dependent methyltransferase